MEKHHCATLVIIDKPMVLSTNKVIQMWSLALGAYNIDEISVVSSKLDFKSLGSLPTWLHGMDVVYVSDKTLYTHFHTIGVDVDMLGHVSGYSQPFLRSAFKQGLAVDYLKRYMTY